MSFANSIISKYIHKLKQFIAVRIISSSIDKIRQKIFAFDQAVKKHEYRRGLYRYPDKMIGRNLSSNTTNTPTDVLVFAAHPDDDVLGLGATLYRHCIKGDHIKVIFVTNGTAGAGESWFRKLNKSNKRANLRFEEAVKALSQINIRREDIYCLGFPDGGTQRYLKKMSTDISMIMEKFQPKRVYVHCIEGGHVDHDMTSFVVKSVCRRLGYSNVFEYAEYNPMQPIGTKNIRFLSTPASRFKEIIIDISEEERLVKKRMLAFHQSQGVEVFFEQGEAIRQAELHQSETELYEHCQLSKRCLQPIIKDFNKMISIIGIFQFSISDIILLGII